MKIAGTCVLVDGAPRVVILERKGSRLDPLPPSTIIGEPTGDYVRWVRTLTGEIEALPLYHYEAEIDAHIPCAKCGLIL